MSLTAHAGLSVAKHTAAGALGNANFTLVSPTGASIIIPASTLHELSVQMCAEGGIALQTTTWGVDKHACSEGTWISTHAP
jgi:hypothetical protein